MGGDLAARLKAYEGRPAAMARAGKDPVNAPMIRHWCEAMGDTNPAYTGPHAIAPPTMLQVWTMGGLSGHGGRTHAYDELLALLDEAGCTSVVATDCEQEYAGPLRPGDEITYDSVIESVSERKTTRLGTGYFVTTRTDVRAGGALAGTHRFRILKYAPARSGGGTARGTRPRPVVNRDNAGFWEGVRRHTLLIQRCTGCGTPRHPWLPGCNACGGADWDTVEASGEGTVYSYVVMHHPPFPAFDPPYAVALVELAEGVRMIGNVVGVPYDKVRIGQPVRLEFRHYYDELVLPVWRAQGSAPEPPEHPYVADNALPPLEIPVTRTLIVAGALASRDYQDVHHDPELARRRGSPDIFMNILTTNGLVGRYVTDHFGPTATLRSVAIRLGAPNHPGDTLVLTGTVETVDDGGTATVRVVGANRAGRHVTGTVTVTVPGEDLS
ncbi:putative OB-fold protein/acyl dehydratase [Streptomyces tendae]